MKFLLKLIRFFRTQLGAKVKIALLDLLEIFTDKEPNRPQLKQFGKTHGKEALFYGLMIGEDELEELIDSTNWHTNRKTAFKKSIAELSEMLSEKIEIVL